MDVTEAIVIFLVIVAILVAAMWGPVYFHREADPSAESAPSKSESGGVVIGHSGGKEGYGPPPGRQAFSALNAAGEPFAPGHIGRPLASEYALNDPASTQRLVQAAFAGRGPTARAQKEAGLGGDGLVVGTAGGYAWDPWGSEMSAAIEGAKESALREGSGYGYEVGQARTASAVLRGIERA